MLKLHMIGRSIGHVVALFHQDDRRMKKVSWVNSSCPPAGVTFKSGFTVIQGGAGLVSKLFGNKIFLSVPLSISRFWILVSAAVMGVIQGIAGTERMKLVQISGKAAAGQSYFPSICHPHPFAVWAELPVSDFIHRQYHSFHLRESSFWSEENESSLFVLKKDVSMFAFCWPLIFFMFFFFEKHPSSLIFFNHVHFLYAWIGCLFLCKNKAHPLEDGPCLKQSAHPQKDENYMCACSFGEEIFSGRSPLPCYNMNKRQWVR